MPIVTSATSPLPMALRTLLTQALWSCMALGLLLAWWPSTSLPWLASLRPWAVLAPLVSLLTLHRHAALAMLTEVMIRRQRRRRPHRRSAQARRLVFSRHRQYQPLRAA